MTENTQPDPAPAPGGDAPKVDPATGKKWGKKKIAALTGGGCCILLIVFFIIGLIGAAITGDLGADPEPSVAATTEATEESPTQAEPTEESAPTEEPTTEPEPEPTEEPTTEPEPEPTEEPTTEPEPEPTEEPTTEDAPVADDAQAWASSVEETALMGSASWQELCGGDYSLGACWISDVTATNVGTLDVTLQLTGSDPEAQGLAEGAANIIFSTAGLDHEDLDWVVVYGADGVVIDQKKRSDFPYLD